MRLFLVSVCLLFSATLHAAKVVNIFNWSNYIPDRVISDFTRETGIKVNYSIYDSNEALYAKLKANPDSGYDLIFPSSYLVKRMIKERMLLRYDFMSIPGAAGIRHSLRNREYDPKNQYSLPFLWGATGLVINTRYHKKPYPSHWSDLWDKKFKNKILLLNDVREVFAIALFRLGYSVNDSNPKHIEAAYRLLLTLMPNIRLFNTLSSNNLYLDEDVTVGMGWNGDISQVMEENSSLRFIYPKEHFSIWIECMAIPRQAAHPDYAKQFIAYILRPSVAARIARNNHYPPTTREAMALLPASYQSNEAFNPSETILARAELQRGVGAAMRVYLKYWQRLKLTDIK